MWRLELILAKQTRRMLQARGAVWMFGVVVDCPFNVGVLVTPISSWLVTSAHAVHLTIMPGFGTAHDQTEHTIEKNELSDTKFHLCHSDAWPGRNRATPVSRHTARHLAAAASAVSGSLSIRPGTRSSRCHLSHSVSVTACFTSRPKARRQDLATGSQRGFFMGHYVLEEWAVYGAITAGAQGGVFLFWRGLFVAWSLGLFNYIASSGIM